MATIERLGADDLRATIVAYRDVLRRCQDVVNRLNVYPVPDGDTGTNMAGTVDSVVAELDALGASTPAFAAVCKAIAYGSLMGARGNSGIILCQILRGLTESFKDLEDVGPSDLAAALTLASVQADKAVARPVEGTILSVVRATAEAAVAAAAGASLAEVVAVARAAAVVALARTPEQLPVLAQAGVVDAGGAGFCLLLDALAHVVTGSPLPEVPPVPDAALAAIGGGRSAGDDLDLSGLADLAHEAGGKDVSELRYEVMYLLEAPDGLIPAFKEVWTGIGDSIVVVGGDGLWNCHIHTDDIGAAIEAALDAGRPRRIKITDLLEQVEEERWVREGALGEVEAPLPPVRCAVVAVSVGDGVRRIFRSLKVHSIVTGGQTMNPSTADLLAAVEAVPADQVILLPNNKNIIPVAEQVAQLSTKSVRVVPTRGVAEGVAALIDYDPEGTADANLAAMSAAAERVVAGEVTRAVRATATDAGPVSEGDWLGITRTGIAIVGTGLADTVTGLLSKLLDGDHEIVTIIEGDGASVGDTRRITGWLQEQHPGVDAEVLHGGQPLYPYLLSIE